MTEHLISLLRTACGMLQERRDELFAAEQVNGEIVVGDVFSANVAEEIRQIDELIKAAAVAIDGAMRMKAVAPSRYAPWAASTASRYADNDKPSAPVENICKNCRFHRSPPWFGAHIPSSILHAFPRCEHPSRTTFDPVCGTVKRYRPCEDARADQDDCGPEGTLYKPSLLRLLTFHELVGER